MIDRWFGRAISVCLVTLGGALGAQASSSTYIFQVASKAQAVITVSTNQINITLYDLYVDPNTVADNLSAFWFTTSVTPTSSSIASSSADSITVASGGTHTDGGNIAPGWVFTDISAVTKLDDLVGTGHAGPANTIIGSPGSDNIYNGPGGDGSINGNTPHNPFLNQSATWTLNEMGITSATTISAVNFQFGTSDGSLVSGGTQVFTPEPASAGLFLLGGISLLLMGRRSLLRSR